MNFYMIRHDWNADSVLALLTAPWEELEAKAIRKKYRGFSPDHVQEIQLNGPPSAHSNLRWMSSRPNSWIGTKMKEFETTGPKKNTGVKPNCCPPP